MARDMDPDHRGPGEFFKFARRLPDDLWPVSIVIGAVFGVLWFLGTVFKKVFSGAAHKEQ